MKLKSTCLSLGIAWAWLLSCSAAFAQRNPLDIAKEHVLNHHAEWNLTALDVADMGVNDYYTTKQTGLSYVYFIQRHQGIPVYNAILNVSISKEGKVFHVGKRFVPDLASKVNTTIPVLNAEDAVKKAAEYLGLTPEPLRLVRQSGQHEYVFEKGTQAREDISAKLRYQPTPQGVFLAWDLLFAPVASHDKWSMRVDAIDGRILDQVNWTVYCSVGEATFSRFEEDCAETAARTHQALTYNFSALGDGAQYNVWPPPTESPIHGPRTMVTDPASPLASPYGWHDTNGAPGPEYTITRGNNTHAYHDKDGNQSSAGDEPNGGSNLIFDATFNPTQEPGQYTDAAVINLFYWTNFMHDFTYHYGFDEPAGNFQQNNYNNGGGAGDPIIARAQADYEATPPSTNNAFYSHTNDGTPGPSINMFVWTLAGVRYLRVDQPASITGEYETGLISGTWGAGASVTTTPVSGEVVIVEDDVEEALSSDGCDTIVNGDALKGKIALIDRGGCQFGWKSFQVQKKGAIAVIICNFEDQLVSPAPGTHGAQVNIPVVFIRNSDCQTIRQFVGNGLSVTIVNSGPISPTAVDGDMDNGIIAHEYGHGISKRLTGGPNANCLNTGEHMGEGWSDWFSLVTSVRPGDFGEMRRGVGVYAMRQPTNGRGIRRYPYSTDMSVNPLTYAAVAANQAVHQRGEVWCVTLWDLYWALVDEYGWDPDIYNGTGGNNIAIRLVMEAFKVQPCEPGFLDGRDAILAVDEVLYNGANQCLIWKVFARRGMGIDADQGLASSAGDQKEGFETYPQCIPELKISKTVTDLVKAGDDVDVTIRVVNHKPETLSGIVVTDELPAGTGFKAGSSNVPASVSGNSVSFDLGSMTFDSEKVITYKMTTDPNKPSKRFFLDDVPTEFAFDNWDFYYIGDEAPNIFEITNLDANSPQWSWFVQNIATASRQILELYNPYKVKGNQPVLRFYHRYNTEGGFDGGLVDVKETAPNPGPWQITGSKMFRNGYTGAIDYQTFVIPNLQAFSGNSGSGFKATYVDLDTWKGKDIKIRFRFGTDAADGAEGWFVDDIEFMDMVNYDGEACVTSSQGDKACAKAPGRGTVIESSEIFDNTKEQFENLQVSIYPNPATDVLNISLASNIQQRVGISVLTIDGKTVMRGSGMVYGNEFFPLDVSKLAKGFYIVKINTAEGVMVKKVVIE